MPRLPGPANVRSVATPTPNAFAANLDVPAQAFGSVANALGNVSNAFQQQAELAQRRALEQQRLADGTAVTEAQLDYDRETGNEFTRLQTEGDFSNPDTLKTFDSYLSDQVGRTLANVSSGVSDLAREDLRLKLETRRNALFQSAQTLGVADLKAKANTAFGNSANAIASWAYRQPDRVDDWLAEVGGTLGNFAGALSPQQEEAAQRSGQIKVIDSAVRGFAERGDFSAARRLLNDPRFDELFTPDERQTMLDGALRLVDQRTAAEQKVADEKREAKSSELRIGITRGTVGEQQLTQALENREINNSQFDTLWRFANSEESGINDDALAVSLRKRIYDGDLDMNGLMEYRNRLTNESMESLMSLTDQMARRDTILDRADISRERKRVDQIIGGVRGPLAILDGGASERVANAMDDFDQRVLKGENPRTVADETIERFRRDPVSLTSLPKPKMWAGRVEMRPKAELEAQVADAQRRTQAEFDAMRMSEDEYVREMQNLEKYLEVVQGLER